MMHLAVREDDLPRAESLVARVGKDFADSAMFAVAHGDSATVARLLASFAALAAGKADEAERGYRSILQDYPDDLEAQWQLATTLYTYNPLRGRSVQESRPVFDGIVKLDPEFLCPI